MRVSPESDFRFDHPISVWGSTSASLSPDPSNSSHTGSNVPADPYPDSWSPLSATWDHEYSQDSHHKQAFLGLLVEVAERNWHRPWALAETDAAPYQHVQTGLTLGRKRTRESDSQNAHSSHIASENNSPTFQQGLEPDHDPAHAAVNTNLKRVGRCWSAEMMRNFVHRRRQIHFKEPLTLALIPYDAVNTHRQPNRAHPLFFYPPDNTVLDMNKERVFTGRLKWLDMNNLPQRRFD